MSDVDIRTVSSTVPSTVTSLIAPIPNMGTEVGASVNMQNSLTSSLENIEKASKHLEQSVQNLNSLKEIHSMIWELLSELRINNRLMTSLNSRISQEVQHPLYKAIFSNIVGIIFLTTGLKLWYHLQLKIQSKQLEPTQNKSETSAEHLQTPLMRTLDIYFNPTHRKLTIASTLLSLIGAITLIYSLRVFYHTAHFHI
jgi:hypothetical protein